MPPVREHEDHALAGCILSVAESRSLDALGVNCHRAVDRMTGSPTIGVYLLDGSLPQLLYGRHVPEGFLAEYEAEFRYNDPLLHSILSKRRTVDGFSLIGSAHWPCSQAYDLLRRWGFAHNMCGPLWFEDRPVGLVYTATRVDAAPYTAVVRERMEMLCRAGSLALAHMIEAGHLGDDPYPWARAASRPAAVYLANLHERLPPRSAEVAIRVCQGQTNKEIAREMEISDHTVKEHVANLCKRVGAHNRTELVTCLLSGTSRQ